MDYKKLLPTHPSFLLERLVCQVKNQGKLIVAYDIDDTVRPYHGASCGQIQSLIRELKDTLDAYLIVFTSNEDIDGVKTYLNENEIPYDVINENAPFVPFKRGKIFYNVLLDDKAGLGEVANTLKQLLYLVNNNLI